MAQFVKSHWSKQLIIETYTTKSGKLRATINGRKADKCALGMIADPYTYSSIYWWSATYEEVLNDLLMQCKPLS